MKIENIDACSDNQEVLAASPCIGPWLGLGSPLRISNRFDWRLKSGKIQDILSESDHNLTIFVKGRDRPLIWLGDNVMFTPLLLDNYHQIWRFMKNIC